jgi:branched-subunit amino acid transport protein
MDQTSIFLIIIGMGLVTFLPRFLPAWLLSSRRLPTRLAAWLRYVPAAVLSAMLFPSLFIHDTALDLSVNNLFFMAAIPTTVVAIFSKNLFASIATGMIVVAAVRFWSG